MIKRRARVVLGHLWRLHWFRSDLLVSFEHLSSISRYWVFDAFLLGNVLRVAISHISYSYVSIIFSVCLLSITQSQYYKTTCQPNIFDYICSKQNKKTARVEESEREKRENHTHKWYLFVYHWSSHAECRILLKSKQCIRHLSSELSQRLYCLNKIYTKYLLSDYWLNRTIVNQYFSLF